MVAAAVAPEQQERIEIRVSAEQKALLMRAAELERRSIEHFVVSAVMAEAESAVRAHESLALHVSPAAFDQIVGLVEQPGEPNDTMREAAADYWSWIEHVDRK